MSSFRLNVLLALIVIMLTPSGAPVALAQSGECKQPSSTGCPMHIGQVAQATFNSPTDLHIWKLDVPDAGRFNVGINKFPADYDLHVYAPSGDLAGESTQEGLYPDAVQVDNAEPGVYTVYIDVNQSRGEIRSGRRRSGDPGVVSYSLYASSVSPESIATLRDHRLGVVSVAFSPDGAELASASQDRTIDFWRVSDGSLIRSIAGPARPISAMAISPDGQLLVTSSDDNTVSVWRTSDGAPLGQLGEHQSQTLTMAFSHDGRYIITKTVIEGMVQLWRVSDLTLVRELRAETSSESNVAFSPDSQMFAFVPDGRRSVELRSTSDDTLQGIVPDDDQAEVTTFTFSPAAPVLAVALGSDGSKIDLVPLSDFGNRRSLLRAVSGGPDGEIVTMAFSPDGTILAASSRDRTVRLWSTVDGTLLRSYVGHTRYSPGLAYSPTGRVLATGSLDATVRIWRAP